MLTLWPSLGGAEYKNTEGAVLTPEPLTEHVYRIDAGALGIYLIALPQNLVLVDAGFPGTMRLVAEALEELGREPSEVTDIVLTHAHPDHAAGLAEIVEVTGAQAWMHADDAALVRAGRAYRPWTVAPGDHNRLFAEQVIKNSPTTYEPVPVDHDIVPGQTIDVAGGMRAIGTPGHTAGHLVYLWERDGGVLFVGDAAKNETCLEPATIYEDFAQGLEDLTMIADLDFEVACFAHGAPIIGGASLQFRRLRDDNGHCSA